MGNRSSKSLPKGNTPICAAESPKHSPVFGKQCECFELVARSTQSRLSFPDGAGAPVLPLETELLDKKPLTITPGASVTAAEDGVRALGASTKPSAWLKSGIVTLLIGLIYASVLKDLALDWWNEERLSYGFLIRSEEHTSELQSLRH